MRRILLVMITMALVACQQPTGVEVTPGEFPVTTKTVTIGSMLPLSGDVAVYGNSIQRGIELAKKDLGRDDIEIVYEDSMCDGKEAVNAINKLISVDQVNIIMGEVCSGATLGAAPIAEQNEIVLISPTSTSPDITTAGNFIFRVIPSDALQGVFAANLVKDLEYGRLAILYTNEDYGLGFKNVLKKEFEQLGGTITSTQAIDRGDVDLRTTLLKIKSSQPDAVFIISNSLDTAIAVLKQIKEIGIEAKLFGSEALYAADILEAAGDAAEGLTVTSTSTGKAAFKAAHFDNYGEKPGPFAAQGYDVFQAVAKVLDTGARTGPELRDALYTLNFEGVSGTIALDENGDTTGNYEIYEVKDGDFISSKR